MLNGDKTGATEAFRKAVAIGEKTTNEYDFAEAELKISGGREIKAKHNIADNH